jgi:hypothetical protein
MSDVAVSTADGCTAAPTSAGVRLGATANSGLAVARGASRTGGST